uniref:NADPH oxidase organizer 1b n=1 Tax=Electrophorus electricus TaxID=8005 RepID=A0AAY5ENH2_ELEEL
MYMTSVLWSDQTEVTVCRSLQDFKEFHRVFCNVLILFFPIPGSVMIFQPEAVPNGLASRKLSSGNVTQPYVTQTYRCVAPYETKDTNNRPFNVAVNETLDVLIKDQAGWWLVENESKCLAWFPAPFLEISPLYCAARSYTAKTRDELSVAIGTMLEVLQKSDNGWWLASICSSSDGMDVRFHSVSSMGSSFEDEEDTGKPESDSESDSAHSGVSGEPPSPTDSESSRLPRMPPRPRTREILSRCTTYTRKAALATQSQLFPERFGPNK